MSRTSLSLRLEIGGSVFALVVALAIAFGVHQAFAAAGWSVVKLHRYWWRVAAFVVCYVAEEAYRLVKKYRAERASA